MGKVDTYTIRGIEISGFRDLSQFADHLFNGGYIQAGTLVAINAEKVITAEQDPALSQLIEEADYKYADGISIVQSIRKKYPEAQVSRIAGADLWEGLMQKAGQYRTPVFLIGSKDNVLHETHKKLIERWQVNIVGMENGYFPDHQREEIFQRIAQSGAKFVTVAMGSPKQEIFMRDCRRYCPDALYMGVGGTYDVFTGRVKRAPKVWRDMGLEWFYRLLSQPTRWRRQVKLVKYAFYHVTGRL